MRSPFECDNISEHNQSIEQSARTKQMFTRTLWLLTAILVANSGSGNSFPNFRASLRGIVFDFDCKHINLVCYHQKAGLFVYKGLVNQSIGGKVQISKESKPMEEVLPDLFRAMHPNSAEKPAPAPSPPSSLVFISSRVENWFRHTIVTYKDTMLTIKQYANSTVHKLDRSNNTHKINHSISTCLRIPTSKANNFYFLKSDQITQVTVTQSMAGIYQNVFQYNVWVNGKDNYIHVTTIAIGIANSKDPTPKLRSYHKQDFEHYQRGYWTNGVMTMFGEEDPQNVDAPDVLQIHIPATKQEKDLMYTHKFSDFFVQPSSRLRTVLYVLAALFALICLVVVVVKFYCFPRTSAQVQVLKSKRQTDERPKLAKFITRRDWARLTSEETRNWVASPKSKTSMFTSKSQ